MSTMVRLASETDLEAIVKLLKKGKLNVEGIEDHIENFIVVEKVGHGEIIGTAGLEVFEGRYGLLRSLAFDAGHWDERAGIELVRILLSHSIQKGLTEIFLLTRSAPFFHFYGFKEIEWERIPRAVKQSPHFKLVQQQLSTAMVFKQVDKPLIPSRK